MVNSKARRAGSFFAKLEPYLYLLPVLCVFGVFVFFPFVRTITMSLSVVNSLGEIVAFSGIKNYVSLFKAPAFWDSLKHTFIFAVSIVPLQICFGVFLALLADNRKRKSSPIRVVFALPMAVSSACASIIWLLLFNSSTGLINFLLGARINWLGSNTSAMAMIIVTTLWLTLGINFIYAYSGIQSVSDDLYESCAIEGAGYLKTVWHITLPTITPTLFFLLVTNTIGAFQTFAQVKLMTQGGPGNATTVLSYSIYREAFLNNRWGYACAQSIVFMIILFTISVFQFRVEKKGVFYQ